jgi:GT2 family glycosyltransferase
VNGRPDLSVVISTFNTRAMLAACLESVFHDLERAGLNYEVIVVDDASTDGSAEMVAARFPQVRLLRHAVNQGYARANNAGMCAAGGAAVFLLNSDTVVVPGSISTLLDALGRGERPAAVGPRLLNPDGTDQRSCWRFPLVWLIGNTLWLFRLGMLDDYGAGERRADRPVDWLSSAALMVKADALADVGPFDEHFGVYGVDVDWALRARRRGHKSVYVPRAQVVHHGRASWGEDALGSHAKPHAVVSQALWDCGAGIVQGGGAGQ